MLILTSDERRALRARAHALNPVVSISQNGLSEAVLKEIGTSLASHELIKIRVFNDDRAVRETFLATICETLQAAPVQHIGKLLVVWRPSDDATSPKSLLSKNTAKPRRPRAPARQTKRSFQGGTRT